MYTVLSLSERIGRSARASVKPCAGGKEGDRNAWFEIRKAVIRATRRELGLPKYGPAPAAVYVAACKYADKAYLFRGWDSSFVEADAGIRPALRRFVRRARMGTL